MDYRLSQSALLRCFCLCFLLLQSSIVSGQEANQTGGVIVTGAIARLDSLWEAGERDSAMTLLDSRLRQTGIAGDSVGRIELLTRKSRFSRQLGDPITCEQSSREALAMAAALGDSSLACAPQRWLAVAMTVQGRHSDARREYSRLLELAENVGDALHQGWANVGLGWDADLQRDDPRSLDHYSRAAKLFRKAGDSEAELWATIGRANARFHMAEYDSAGIVYQRVVEIAREAGLRRHEALTLNNLAGLHFALGRPDLSEQLYVRAIAIWDSIGLPEDRVPPALNRGSCLGLLGLDDEARAVFEAELIHCREANLRDLEARVLRRLANLEKKSGREALSIQLLEEVLSLGDELPVLERTEAVTDLAQLLVLRGDCEAAVELTRKQRAIQEIDATTLHSLRLDMAMGQSLLCLNRHQEALRSLRRAHQACTEAYNRFRLEIEPLMADCFHSLGEPDSTLHYLSAAADHWEAGRENPLDPAWREERGRAGKKIYTDLAWEFLTRADTTQAFDRLQHYKARTLQERMRGPGKLFRQALDATAAPVTLAELQKTVLRPDEMLLDTYLGPNCCLFFAVTSDTCRVICLPGEGTLVPRLQRLHELLSRPAEDNGAIIDTVLCKLSDQLCGSIRDLVETSERIVFCPDGILNLLPPECLEFGTSRKSQWSRAPSASILRDLRQLPDRAAGEAAEVVVLMGEENEKGETLHGAKREVEHLAQSYKGVDVFVIPALGGSLKDNPFPGADLLHIAAHARGDDNNSWQSSVIFGPGESLRLRAADLAEMELAARLVVLSSCSSAGGRILSGEGVLGLTSAFLASGVPSVVATLWPVDDLATAQFMQIFYRQLARGETAGRALCEARNLFRQNPETAHPFYWAGFILVGDGDIVTPLAARSRNQTWFWLLPGAVLFIVAARAVSARRRRQHKA
jgi:tetratricopeptide (TPR) repeat protein